MNKRPCFRSLRALSLSLMLAGAAFAQNASTKKTLVVNGLQRMQRSFRSTGMPVIPVKKYATAISEAKAAGALLR